jgi:hypothetical protein
MSAVHHPVAFLDNQWSGVSSSNVSSVKYDGDAMRLFVQFHSGSGHYEGVPLSVAAALAEAPSAGKYVHAVLRPGYTWVRG